MSCWNRSVSFHSLCKKKQNKTKNSFTYVRNFKADKNLNQQIIMCDQGWYFSYLITYIVI